MKETWKNAVYSFIFIGHFQFLTFSSLCRKSSVSTLLWRKRAKFKVTAKDVLSLSFKIPHFHCRFSWNVKVECVYQDPQTIAFSCSIFQYFQTSHASRSFIVWMTQSDAQLTVNILLRFEKCCVGWKHCCCNCFDEKSIALANSTNWNSSHIGVPRTEKRLAKICNCQ